MRKKIFYFEIKQDNISKNTEKELILLFPEYVANKAVFLDSDKLTDKLTDKFYLINDLEIIINFTNKLQDLNIEFLYQDLTFSFLNAEIIDLDSEKTHNIITIYYRK